MLDHSAAMLAFLKLAGVSQTREQLAPRDKFLVLGGVSALKAGWPEVAERCRQLILTHNPSHHLGHYPSFANAMTNSDFEEFLRPYGKFCSYERAEHLLNQLAINPGRPRAAANLQDGEYALLLLARADATALGERIERPADTDSD